MRRVILLQRDSFGQWVTVRREIQLALAACPACGGRFRVLPCDVLPRKRYGLAVIELLARLYAQGGRSLRSTVWDMLGDQSPVHSTLHAWTEGLGAHALGRPAGDVPGATPISRVLSESEAHQPEVSWGEPARSSVRVDPRRYRSSGRFERLQASAWILALAERRCRSRAPSFLSSWRADLVRWAVECPFQFRTGLSCTSFEHVQHRPRPP